MFMTSHIFHSSCWQPSGELFVLLSWSCLWWTSLRSQHSVFWSTVTAGWGFSEGTEWWRDLRLDLVDSRGGFQPLLKAGLSVSLDQVFVVVSLSSIIGEKRYSFWFGRKFGIFPCGIFVCFIMFSFMWCTSALSSTNQTFFYFGWSYPFLHSELLISHLSLSSLH